MLSFHCPFLIPPYPFFFSFVCLCVQVRGREKLIFNMGGKFQPDLHLVQFSWFQVSRDLSHTFCPEHLIEVQGLVTFFFFSFRKRNFKWNPISLIKPIYLQRLYEVPVPRAQEDSSIQLKDFLSRYFLTSTVLVCYLGSISFLCIYSCGGFLSLFHTHTHTYTCVHILLH